MHLITIYCEHLLQDGVVSLKEACGMLRCVGFGHHVRLLRISEIFVQIFNSFLKLLKYLLTYS